VGSRTSEGGKTLDTVRKKPQRKPGKAGLRGGELMRPPHAQPAHAARSEHTNGSGPQGQTLGEAKTAGEAAVFRRREEW